MKKQLYLTFDNDWAIDEVLEYSLEILKEYNAVATFFVTNESSVLSKLEDNGNELGIHPNFNYLELCDKEQMRILVNRCLTFVPNAKSIRSHSLITGTPIRQCLCLQGLVYELNTMISPLSGTCVSPWKHNGLWQIPYIFEDDVYLLEGTPFLPSWYITGNFEMLRILNFHPIHVYLNTEKLERYSNIREYARDFTKLSSYRNSDIHNGTEVTLRNMIETAIDSGYTFGTISEIGEML